MSDTETSPGAQPGPLQGLVDVIESSDAPLTDNQRWALARWLHDCGVRPAQSAPEQSRATLALQLIARDSCERLTTGPGSCWRQEAWTADGKYLDDRWCLPCIALAALQDVPFGLLQHKDQYAIGAPLGGPALPASLSGLDLVGKWNAVVPVGTTVCYWPDLRSDPVVTRTRSAAWRLGDGTAVVSIDGRAGSVALDRVSAVVPEGGAPDA